MNAGSVKWAIFLFSPMAHTPTVPCNRWKKSFTCNPDSRLNDLQPGVRSVPPLARRPGFRQLLRALPRSQELGVGDLLAGWWILQLDYRALDPRADHDARPLQCAPRSAFQQSVMGV